MSRPDQLQGYAPYLNEWTELLRRDRNHPAVVAWCPFNETGNDAGEIQQMANEALLLPPLERVQIVDALWHRLDPAG